MDSGLITRDGYCLHDCTRDGYCLHDCTREVYCRHDCNRDEYYLYNSTKEEYCILLQLRRGRRGRNPMVVKFTTIFVISASITTEVVSSNPTQVRCTRYNIM
jgi:hypothetical protein